MPTLRLSATGPAAPDEVWDRYARPARWSSWSPQIHAVRCRGDRIAAGLTGTVVGPGVGPMRLRVPFEVIAVDPEARYWSWRVRLGPLAVVLHHQVLASGSGTRTTLDLAGPVLTVPALAGYAPVAQFALRRLVA